MGADLAPGFVIDGRYRVDRVLGQGGMGTVWAATHVGTRKPVALKVLLDSSSDRPEMRRRFQREARAASAVTHPNIVAVHDIFEMDGGAPVMVMDLLIGEPLENKLLREGRLSVEEMARVLVPVVSAVGTVHERGIVHRDLKPANIFLAEEDGREVVKVLDFGIAKLSTAERSVGQSGALTSTGAMMGTPFYMAPEQCVGERDVDHRADVWALGVIVYECLAGSRPIVAENLGQVIKKVLVDGMPTLSVPGVPDDVVALVGRMLSRERADRPQDLGEVKALLERYAPPGVHAPSFGPPAMRAADGVPSSDVPSSDTPVRSGMRIVAGTRGVDAEASTANASSSSDLSAASPVRATSGGGSRRGRIAAGALFAIVAAMGAAAVLTRPPSGSATGASIASALPAANNAEPSASGAAGSQQAPSSAVPTAPTDAVPSSPSASASAPPDAAAPSAAPSSRATSQPRSPVASAAASARVPVAPVVSAAPAASSAGRPTPGALIERAPF